MIIEDQNECSSGSDSDQSDDDLDPNELVNLMPKKNNKKKLKSKVRRA